MAVETGVAYFSGRTLRHVRADLADMVEHGCTYVVHCLTETDLAYHRQTMADIVRATHEAGLEAWLDPWGVTGIFSGETFTRFPLQHPETWQVLSDGRRVPAACPNHPATRQFVRQWVEAAAATGGDVLMWDEPHFYVGPWVGDLSGAWACHCDVCQAAFRERFGTALPQRFDEQVRAFREASLLELLADACRLGHEKGMRNALCLVPTGFRPCGLPGGGGAPGTRGAQRRGPERPSSTSASTIGTPRLPLPTSISLAPTPTGTSGAPTPSASRGSTASGPPTPPAPTAATSSSGCRPSRCRRDGRKS